LLGDIRAKHTDILDAIRNEKELSKATEDKLKGVIEAYARTFA
jgi:F-type H+-transporting ATPase subunit alpha